MGERIWVMSVFGWEKRKRLSPVVFFPNPPKFNHSKMEGKLEGRRGDGLMELPIYPQSSLTQHLRLIFFPFFSILSYSFGFIIFTSTFVLYFFLIRYYKYKSIYYTTYVFYSLIFLFNQTKEFSSLYFSTILAKQHEGELNFFYLPIFPPSPHFLF